MIKFKCAHCGNMNQTWPSAFNRARREGANLYCDKVCSGLGRRKGKTKIQLKAEKASYDVQYRIDNLDKIRTDKAARHKRIYDPVQAAIERKEKMPRHVEYCRQPEYRAWKQGYDKSYRAIREYGPFADAFLTLQTVEAEIKTRATDYEIRMANETINKITKRKRQYAQAAGYGRSDQATRSDSIQPQGHPLGNVAGNS